jgi:FkbM family methyltransferase
MVFIGDDMPTELLDYDKAEIRVVANTEMERRYRIKPAFKEPETVAWIDEHVREGDVFYDIGANIGAYGLIAASRGATVYSFEPEAMNYGRLVQNIELNKDLADRLFALPFTLWDSHEILNLHMQQARPGAAMHVIGNGTEKPGYPFRQTVFTLQLNDLGTWGIPSPTHMKVDVDGHERRVLAGASLVLSSPMLKSVMIEIDHKIESDTEAVFSMMRSADLHEKGSWLRTEPVRNHLFGRI